MQHSWGKGEIKDPPSLLFTHAAAHTHNGHTGTKHTPSFKLWADVRHQGNWRFSGTRAAKNSPGVCSSETDLYGDKKHKDRRYKNIQFPVLVMSPVHVPFRKRRLPWRDRVWCLRGGENRPSSPWRRRSSLLPPPVCSGFYLFLGRLTPHTWTQRAIFEPERSLKSNFSVLVLQIGHKNDA